MRDCNRDQLFTVKSSEHLRIIAILLLIYGVIELISTRWLGYGSSLSFAVAVFIASVCLSFSKIFKKAMETKLDNDLTI